MATTFKLPGSDDTLDGRFARTLSDQDPDLAVRAAAYQKRQSKIKEKRKSKQLSSENFLSNVQEMDDDVTYRFNFIVVGASSGKVVESICTSESASRLGGSAMGGSAMGATLSSKNNYRCLCEVQVHVNGDKGPLVKKVAKLAMNPLSFDQDMPIWETRQEAMSSAIVYVLWIDGKTHDGESNFDDQLQGFRESLKLLRSNSRARLRPVKAVLLLYTGKTSGAPKPGLERWALSLADFEQTDGGDLWKFGPLCLEDLDLLHATFAEMTTTRLKHAQNDKDDPSLDEPPPGEGQDIYRFKPSAGNVQAMRGTPSDAASSVCSERELPPAFEAEASGSECSETAMELHRLAFGLCEDDMTCGQGQPARTPSFNIAQSLETESAKAAGVDANEVVGASLLSSSELELGPDFKVVVPVHTAVGKGFCCSFFC
mmetsp:Transcript_173973/g.557722  ORF Transcript_173973/g.557722 Transcript_173973/m.557722 type:complete len:428 (-) Transcript_173973:221-1504(-)